MTTSTNGHISHQQTTSSSDSLKELLDQVADAARESELALDAIREHGRQLLDAHVQLGNAATDGNLAAYVNALNEIEHLKRQAGELLHNHVVNASLTDAAMLRLRERASTAVVATPRPQS